MKGKSSLYRLFFPFAFSDIIELYSIDVVEQIIIKEEKNIKSFNAIGLNAKAKNKFYSPLLRARRKQL